MDIFNPRQRMIAAALMEIAHEEGKFDWGVGANGAHYVPASENPFLPQNIRCEKCVFYADDGGCAIVAGEIEDNAVCKFWTIPESEIIQVLPVSDEVPMDEMPMDVEPMDDMKSADSVNLHLGDDTMHNINTPDDIADAYHKRIVDQDGPEGFDDFKAELIAIAKRKGADYVAKLPKDWRDEMKSVMTMDEARAIVQEYAQLHPDKASIVYESIEQDLMSGKITKEELLGQSSKANLSTAEQDEMQKQIVMTAKRYLAFLDS